jgi:GTP cyclohydrolase II
VQELVEKHQDVLAQVRPRETVVRRGGVTEAQLGFFHGWQDKNLGLAKQVLKHVAAKKIKKLTHAYVTLSLEGTWVPPPPAP